jgi:hypothetical protein
VQRQTQTNAPSGAVATVADMRSLETAPDDTTDEPPAPEVAWFGSYCVGMLYDLPHGTAYVPEMHVTRCTWRGQIHGYRRANQPVFVIQSPDGSRPQRPAERPSADVASSASTLLSSPAPAPSGLNRSDRS